MVANVAGSVVFFVSTGAVMAGAALVMWRSGQRPPSRAQRNAREADPLKEAR